MKTIFLWLIRIYQKYVSPYKGRSSCRFYPTCSTYAYQAISRYGAFKGGAMALWRILRCNPFSKGGYDPLK